MKCPNCNKRIFIKDKHCPSCGFDLTNSPKKETKTIKIDKKFIINILIIVIILLSLTGIILKEKYDKKTVAAKYFEALITQNSSKAYKYINAKKSKFINEKTFKKIISKENELKDVINYTIQDINYSYDKKEVTITFSYITKKNKDHQTKNIVLTNKGKKLLLYENWKIDTTNMISNNYKLFAPKKYDIEIEGIKLGKKEIASSNKNYYIYQINQIFLGNYDVSVNYKKMDLVSRISVQKHNSYSYINNLFLPQEESTKLTKNLVGQLENLYKSAIKSKSYKDCKKKLTLAKDNKIKNIYEELMTSTDYYYGQLKDFKVKDYNIISTKIENKVHLVLAIKYKYKIKKYDKVEEKTKTDDIDFIVKREKDKYKLYNIKNLTYYFN